MAVSEMNLGTWERAEVSSPRSAAPVPVVVARGLPTTASPNRMQSLDLYLPYGSDSDALVGTPVTRLPRSGEAARSPHYQVHVHGGAWRDPQLTATSIEAAVACTFAEPASAGPITAIASLDYTLTHFPTHPTLPYDVVTAGHADPAREAVHPRHLADVLRGLALLRRLGLTDGSYVLTGHSAGACLAFQAVLQSPRAYGLEGIDDAPCPAAIVGLNGLYDLPALVDGLGASHAQLRGIYEMLLSNAFGVDRAAWPAASPARFDPSAITARVRAGRVPGLVLLDQSAEDQLVPMNQRERLAANLGRVEGLRVALGHRCTGVHAAPWEQGQIIWDSVRDVLGLLRLAED